MSTINPISPTQTLRFKANAQINQPISKKEEKSSWNFIFDKPLGKAKYVAGIGAGLGLFQGMCLDWSKLIIMGQPASKVGATIGLGIGKAVKLTCGYLLVAAAVNYLKKNENTTNS